MAEQWKGDVLGGPNSDYHLECCSQNRSGACGPSVTTRSSSSQTATGRGWQRASASCTEWQGLVLLGPSWHPGALDVVLTGHTLLWTLSVLPPAVSRGELVPTVSVNSWIGFTVFSDRNASEDHWLSGNHRVPPSRRPGSVVDRGI